MDIQQLLSKWLNNEITTKELAEWYHNNHEGKNIEAELSAMLEKEWDNEDRPEELHYSSKQLQQLVTNVLKRGDVKTAVGRTGRVYWLKIGRLAAAVFVFVFIGVVVWQRYGPKKQFAAEQSAADIAPGTNKAILTLANGSQVSLDSAGSQVIYQGNAVIKQSAGGKLAYSGDNGSSDAGGGSDDIAAKMQYNTLATPRGGTFQLTLPDGTKAWLNSASFIRYPVAFNANERVVETSGEVYLEIVHNAKVPFRIKTRTAMIEDVGTAMDICDYPDEKSATVTLAEGAAKVLNLTGNRKEVLKAGQQGLLDGSSLDVQQVDVEAVTAWKNGYFRFNNEDIVSVMKKLSRWYDIKVEYQGMISPDNYTGTISMHRNISNVLDMLGYSQTVHFKIVDQKIIVGP
ncbi:MAG TPA: FecR domain-containing protein [Puia sp.]|jgi:ferric-dicitrate binding protein FerR (iron transport regulator)